MSIPFSDFIVFIEHIAAFGAEFRRIGRVFGFPAAFIALIYGCSRRTWLSAVLTELAHIHRTARTRPALTARLGFSAFHTEFARIAAVSARTRPCIG